ncbi:MAG: hypothetical protein K6E40_10505 [Desulfovibrio sp.]|nr:hypothetical protein [Desulfovibrio sp.]
MDAFPGRSRRPGFARTRLAGTMNGGILPAEEAKSLKLEHSLLHVGRK